MMFYKIQLIYRQTKIKDRLQLIIIMKLQHQLQFNKNNEFYLGKTGKSILELEDKGDLIIIK